MKTTLGQALNLDPKYQTRVGVTYCNVALITAVKSLVEQACESILSLRSLPRFSTFQMLHYRVGSWPYPQTLDQTKKACEGPRVQLIMKIRKLRTQIVLYYKPLRPHDAKHKDTRPNDNQPNIKENNQDIYYSVVMLSVANKPFMLSVAKHNVVMLSVVAPHLSTTTSQNIGKVSQLIVTVARSQW